MVRRYFSQVLREAGFDIKKEYDKLFTIFNTQDSDGSILRDLCERFFLTLPFRGTCISFDEFNKTYGFCFERSPKEFDINYLVNYCEYIYNIVINIDTNLHFSNSRFPDPKEHIETLIETIGYMSIKDNDFTLFVPKSQPAIVVSETLPPDLSYKVIEYNHHSMKGNLERKQATLKLLADQLEAKKKELNNLNSSLSGDLFYLLNNLNIRHNNIDPDSKGYKKGVADMSNDELEEWYDKTYDICLYAFMTLDQADRNAKVKALKQKIEDRN